MVWHHLYVESKKKLYKWTYKRETDSQTSRMSYGCWRNGSGEGIVTKFEMDIYTVIFKIDNQLGPTIEHTELCSVLCGSQDGWGVWERMDTCMCMVESICYSTESISYVNQLCCCLVIQFSSVAQSCLYLCDPMGYGTPVLPVLQYLQSSLKFMVTKWVMPPNHSSSVVPFSSCLQSFQHQGLFQ